MKNRKKTFSFDILLLWFTMTTVVILRSIAVSRNLNFEFGYFNDSTLINVAGWLTFGFCILFSISALITKKNEPLIPTFNTPATYIPAALVAAAMLFLSKSLFTRFISLIEQKHLDFPAALALLCALAAIGCVAGLFLFIMIEDRKSHVRSYFLMLISLFFIFYASYLYFDTALPINAPNKITDQIAYVSASIFFLFETRISTGQSQWKGYAAFGIPAAILTAFSSIPSLTVFFINGKVISNSIYETALTFTLFLFIVARLILVDEYASDRTSVAARIIKNAVKKPSIPEISSAEAIDFPNETDEQQEDIVEDSESITE